MAPRTDVNFTFLVAAEQQLHKHLHGEKSVIRGFYNGLNVHQPSRTENYQLNDVRITISYDGGAIITTCGCAAWPAEAAQG